MLFTMHNRQQGDRTKKKNIHTQERNVWTRKKMIEHSEKALVSKSTVKTNFLFPSNCAEEVNKFSRRAAKLGQYGK